MKLNKLLLAAFLLIIITCEDRRSIFAENIKKYVQTIKKPKGSENLIYDFDNKLTLLIYTLTLKELNEVQIKYDLSDSLTKQIKTAPYARVSGGIKVEEASAISFNSYENILGSAIREDDGKVSFALIKVRSFAKLRVQYEPFPVKVCKTIVLIFKKCHYETYQKSRPLTESEKLLINEATKYSAINSILEAVDILKNGDYELYMSDTGSIFSPDKKSVAHISYFGDISIGPSSELNSILPIQYKYINNTASNKTEVTGNYTKLTNYPSILVGYRQVIRCELFLNKGHFYKFNNFVNWYLTKFPLRYIYGAEFAAKKGPFVLEVKKTGNVILYEKNTKKIVWQTNTANKGKGPYNFHLTNDKILILEDSEGKILYKSDKYKNTPTIFYGNNGKNGNHTYNGLNLNQGVTYGTNGTMKNGSMFPIISPKKFHIMTDDDKKYKIIYGGRIQDTQNWFEFDNQGNYHPEKYYENMKISSFYAKMIYDDEDDDDNELGICYTVTTTSYKWTNIACNGVKVDVYNDYIYDIIIYVKKLDEGQIDISNNVSRDYICSDHFVGFSGKK